MLLIRKPSSRQLREVADDHESALLTYEDEGATVRGELPPGFHHVDESVRLGAGREVQERAAEALRRWAPHLGAGLVVSEDARVEPDAVVALAAPLPIVGWTIATCRIVEVIDEDSRVGFAYGTLRTHPESGEELFMIERDDADEVSFRIAAFSRAHETLAKLAGPLGRLLQRRATRGYLEAMQRAVQS